LNKANRGHNNHAMLQYPNNTFHNSRMPAAVNSISYMHGTFEMSKKCKQISVCGIADSMIHVQLKTKSNPLFLVKNFITHS